MKKTFITAALLYLYFSANAQLTIQNGAMFFVSENVMVTLQDADFINNGTVSVNPAGRFLFTGNTITFIAGQNPTTFALVEIAKTNGGGLKLDQSASLQEQLVFTSGLLYLNGYNINMSPAALLVNEREESRTTGTNGGELILSTALNQPNSANPGNLGAIISSNQNLGNTTIRRGHVPVPSPAIAGGSVQRYYIIEPENDNGLNATLRLHYLNAELNGLDEPTLVPWKSIDDGITWTMQSSSANITSNTDDNYVELSGINSLSYWTLANANMALPVRFVLFDVACNPSGALVTWQTATELNSATFEVQRSINGAGWVTISSVDAAGNSSELRSYGYADTDQVTGQIFYRIKETDIDGKEQYTTVISTACGFGKPWQVWPNPAQQQVFISVQSDSNDQASIQLLDNRGALVRNWSKNLIRGGNQFSVDLQGLSAGMYYLTIRWANGRVQKTAKIVKE